MIRPLLILSLALFAANAYATEATEAEAEATGCPKSETVQGKATANESGRPEARPGAPAPVRPRGTVPGGKPRWHSLLPGMIR